MRDGGNRNLWQRRSDSNELQATIPVKWSRSLSRGNAHTRQTTHSSD